MVRSLPIEWTGTTDKTMADQRDEQNGTPERGHRTVPDTGTAPPAPASAVPTATSASRRRSPLITAIEIENFKGIGAPVRIDLRPITLLFGRNSAGKSTILQALCYAHEILSHRNVDAHKTELGGEQVDLGGFRQFVHGHNLDRVVRLRFELNLENWRVPAALLEKMTQGFAKPAHVDEFKERLEANEFGWVELAVKASASDTVVLDYYEVGTNGEIVGRLQQRKLVFNWKHPLLESLSGTELEVDLPDESVKVQSLDRGLPDWDEPLPLHGISKFWEDDEQVAGFGADYFPKLQMLLSGALVGIGANLRDELAKLRYLGPAREMRPRTDAESDRYSQGRWSDGSAAWDLLLHRDQLADFWDGDLLKEVNDWLVREDRLDSGCRLRRQSTVQLPADAPPVSRIQRHEQLFAKYRNQEGVVDVDKFIRDKKPLFVKKLGFRPDQAEKKIREGFELELIGIVEQLEKGNPPSDVKALVRAVTKAEVQRTLQLVTAEKELEVRTSDIGVGISQILPVVVAALDPDRPGITTIEQPELHVHPKMQVELGDLFAAALGRPVSGFAALSDQRDPPAGVFLIETHSEHLILRLLRRIEETHSGELPDGKPALTPDQVSVVFLEQTDGEVRATRLRVDESGEFIDRWPQGFFRERAAELF